MIKVLLWDDLAVKFAAAQQLKQAGLDVIDADFTSSEKPTASLTSFLAGPNQVVEELAFGHFGAGDVHISYREVLSPALHLQLATTPWQLSYLQHDDSYIGCLTAIAESPAALARVELDLADARGLLNRELETLRSAHVVMVGGHGTILSLAVMAMCKRLGKPCFVVTPVMSKKWLFELRYSPNLSAGAAERVYRAHSEATSNDQATNTPQRSATGSLLAMMDPGDVVEAALSEQSAEPVTVFLQHVYTEASETGAQVELRVLSNPMWEGILPRMELAAWINAKVRDVEEFKFDPVDHKPFSNGRLRKSRCVFALSGGRVISHKPVSRVPIHTVFSSWTDFLGHTSLVSGPPASALNRQALNWVTNKYLVSQTAKGRKRVVGAIKDVIENQNWVPAPALSA